METCILKLAIGLVSAIIPEEMVRCFAFEWFNVLNNKNLLSSKQKVNIYLVEYLIKAFYVLLLLGSVRSFLLYDGKTPLHYHRNLRWLWAWILNTVASWGHGAFPSGFTKSHWDYSLEKYSALGKDCVT